MASKLEVALKGNPPPTSSLRTLTLFALLGVVKLGPFRVALYSVIISDVLLISFPKLLTTFPKTKRRTDFFQAYRFQYTKKKSIRLNLFAKILFQNITCLFFPLPILLTMKRSVGSGQKYRRGTDCCFQSSTGSVKNKSVQPCRTATGLRKFAGRRRTTSISLIHF